jgi:Holliday junction DNA helicase RuvA
MIAFLKGRLIEKRSDHAVLDVQGVGYRAGIPLSTYLELGEIGEMVELFIYTHVTDNSLSLFGFHSEEEREIFLKLISISGIGPKLALNILSGIEVSDLKDAIKQGDVARISLVPGIGKKTAMRIALELQEKLIASEKLLEVEGTQEKEDVISALMNMGFKRKEVERIVDETIKELSVNTDFDTLLREGLRRLARI